MPFYAKSAEDKHSYSILHLARFLESILELSCIINEFTARSKRIIGNAGTKLRSPNQVMNIIRGMV